MDYESSLMFFSVREYVFAIKIVNLLEVSQIDIKGIHFEEGPFKYSFDFRGTRTPIVDLAEYAGMEPTVIKNCLHLLVVETDSHPLAFLIDKVIEVSKGKGAEYRFPEMFRSEKNRYIKAVYLLDNKVSFMLDPAQVLSGDEMAAMKAF